MITAYIRKPFLWRPFLFVLALAGGLTTHSPTLFAQSDTLFWSDFREQVVRFHPAARQAALTQARVEAELFSAKGGFDLKTFADYEEKQFNKKTYFRHLETGVKLPLWYGLELKTAYNRAEGDFVNPEAGLPANGQAAFGFEWSLLRGLMMDERRADLLSARQGLALGGLEQRALLNNLSYEAAKAYSSWVLADNQMAIIQEALERARIRHEGLRERFLQGDAPAIDTLETFIQLQNREIDLSLATLDRKNAMQQMQIFNWDEPARGQTPFTDANRAPQLEAWSFAPEKANVPSSNLLSEALESHPELGMYRVKARQLNIEKRLKMEDLKPMLNVNYNILGNGWSFFPTPTENGIAMLANDIKWGVNFSMPIPNRKARGGVELAKLKIVQNEFYINQKSQEIENKVLQYHNELATLRTQVTLLRNITANYRALLDGETEKFQLGESTVFLVNTREQRWLDAQIKYLKLLSEYRKSEAGLLWAMGGFY